MDLVLVNTKIEISSRDIASLTGKKHMHVKRDIRDQLGEDASKFGHIYLDGMNREQEEYILPKNIAIGVISGYSFGLRMKIIDRLEHLETENKQLIIENTKQHAQLLELKLQAKDDVIRQLSSTNKQYKKIVKDNTAYISANGLAANETFTAKGFRNFMKTLGLVKRVPRLTHYLEATEAGLESDLVVIDENGTPYYDVEKCVKLYHEELTTED